jgi:hypothetical protein
MWPWRQLLGWLYCLRDTEDWLQPPDCGREAWNSLSQPPEGTSLTNTFQTSGLLNTRKEIFIGRSHQVCDKLITAAWGNLRNKSTESLERNFHSMAPREEAKRDLFFLKDIWIQDQRWDHFVWWQTGRSCSRRHHSVSTSSFITDDLELFVNGLDSAQHVPTRPCTASLPSPNKEMYLFATWIALSILSYVWHHNIAVCSFVTGFSGLKFPIFFSGNPDQIIQLIYGTCKDFSILSQSLVFLLQLHTSMCTDTHILRTWKNH